jgi:DoxX-like protein
VTIQTTARTIRTSSQASGNPVGRLYHAASNSSRTLWATQGALAVIFLFAGVSKLVMSAESLTQDTDFPVAFLRFIGVCETLGAVGLILPGMLRIRRELTPLAAAGLVVIMVGAVATTVVTMGVAPASIPLAVGCAAAFIATSRARQLA